MHIKKEETKMKYTNKILLLSSMMLLASCGNNQAPATTSARAANTVDYVLVAEPSMTPALSKNAKASQYASISEEYAKKSGNKPIMQASVFVNDNADADKVNAFLGTLEKDIAAFIENPAVIDSSIAGMSETEASAKLGVPSLAVLKAVSKNGNRMGLGYKNAFENKAAIDNFLTLFGLTAAESAYYKGQSTAPESYELDLKIACPSGAPAVALYKHLKEPEAKLEINASATNVVAYLAPNSSKDIVIAPTNAGITAINKKNAPFKLAATITFGNFYLAATGNDANGKLDPDDYVVAFQQNNVPDKIFRYVYSDVAFTNLHYVDQASDAAACLISGINIADSK